MHRPIPYLAFTDDTGLQSDRFATFRLGRAWVKRLEGRDRVYIGFKHDVLGSSRVLQVKCAAAREILQEFATQSHMEVGGDNDPAAAAERRFVSLQRLYGPHKVREITPLTVIILDKIQPL